MADKNLEAWQAAVARNNPSPANLPPQVSPYPANFQPAPLAVKPEMRSMPPTPNGAWAPTPQDWAKPQMPLAPNAMRMGMGAANRSPLDASGDKLMGTMDHPEKPSGLLALNTDAPQTIAMQSVGNAVAPGIGGMIGRSIGSALTPSPENLKALRADHANPDMGLLPGAARMVGRGISSGLDALKPGYNALFGTPDMHFDTTKPTTPTAAPNTSSLLEDASKQAAANSSPLIPGANMHGVQTSVPATDKPKIPDMFTPGNVATSNPSTYWDSNKGMQQAKGGVSYAIDPATGKPVRKDASGVVTPLQDYGAHSVSHGAPATGDQHIATAGFAGGYTNDNPLAHETALRLEREKQGQDQQMINYLIQQAQHPAEDDGTFSGIGRAKRASQGAQHALAQIFGMKQAQMTGDITKRGQDMTLQGHQLANEQAMRQFMADQDYKDQMLAQGKGRLQLAINKDTRQQEKDAQNERDLAAMDAGVDQEAKGWIFDEDPTITKAKKAAIHQKRTKSVELPPW